MSKGPTIRLAADAVAPLDLEEAGPDRVTAHFP